MKRSIRVHVRRNKFLVFLENASEVLTHILLFLFLLIFVTLLAFCAFMCIRLFILHV